VPLGMTALSRSLSIMSDDRLRAERRLDLGLALAGDGDHAAAVEALQAACDLAPGWVEAHFALAENLEKLPGHAAQAEAAYRTCLSLEPADRMGARIRLTLLGAAPTPDRLPAAYVEALFDQEARRFDAKMREKLSYQGPEAVAEAVHKILPDLAHPARVLDLGCGTGLIAPSLRLAAGRLDGLDLSSGMLVQAVATGLYDSVRQGDLLKDAWLIDEQPYDLIAAGDVLNYIGDLAPVFQSAAAALSPGGFFVFTVEAGEDTQIELGEGHRYRHGDTRLRPWIAAALLDLVSLERRVLRQEKRQPVYGLICITRKPTLPVDMGLPVPHHDQKTV
jgi:predicted TPR repeat methyltransferase